MRKRSRVGSTDTAPAISTRRWASPRSGCCDQRIRYKLTREQRRVAQENVPLRRSGAPIADRLRSGYLAESLPIDAEEIPRWLDGYCSSHLDETLGVATLRLLRSAYTL